jgi:hypothetical protein
MNEIRARCVDGTWVGYYLVTDCSRTWARLHPLSVHRLSTSDVSESQAESLEKMKVVYEAHKIVHRGPHKWSVVRKIDSAVLVQDLEQKDAAQTWLDAYARKETSGASIPVAPVATASS